MKIDWQPDVKDLFERLMAGVPEDFRSTAAEANQDLAESLATERGSASVEKKDLVMAVIKNAPPFAQPMVFDNLRSCGVDPEEYVAAQA